MVHYDLDEMVMRPDSRVLLLVCLLAAFAASGGAGEAATQVCRQVAQHPHPGGARHIAFICSAGPQGGDREFLAGGLYLAQLINRAYPQAYAVVYPETQWPIDLSDADAVVVALDHGGRTATDRTILAAMARHAGFMAIHSGLRADDGEEADRFLGWLGGRSVGRAVAPAWIPAVRVGEHPTTRGVTPFAVEDGWDRHPVFRDDLTGITPVLSAIPPMPPARDGGTDADPDGMAAKPQPLAWACERVDGGRGFGFTGFQRFGNLRSDSFRTALLNGVAWVAGLDIPAAGVASPTPSEAELARFIAEARLQAGP